jgi:hypothetical protein
MVVLEFLLISVVGGVLLGFGLRAYDEYVDRQREEIKKQ